MFLIKFQYSEERLLRHLHVSNLFHTLLSALLLLQQFALTADVTTIALGRHVLTYLLHCLTGDDLRPDGSLDGDVELLTGNELLQFLAHPASEGDGIILMRQRRQCIDGLSVEQDIQFRQLRGTEAVDMVV